jgi:hypothetical protein
MKRVILFGLWCAISVLIVEQSLAKDNRFVEFPDQYHSTTYDLSTVQFLLPRKFSIVATIIDNPDRQRARLKVFDALDGYCKRPDGEYEAPPELFTLGPPDLPITKIVVRSYQTNFIGKYIFKDAKWYLPYKRLAYDAKGEYPTEVLYRCRDIDEMTTLEFHNKGRSEILNGYRQKQVYDCDRALMNVYTSDSLLELPMSLVRSGTGFSVYYERLCRILTGKAPYEPFPYD